MYVTKTKRKIYVRSYAFCIGMDSMHFETGRSRSTKVVDIVTNPKHVCDFLLVRHSNFGPILYRFRDIAGFLLIQLPSTL